MKKRIILLLSLLCSLVFKAQTWTCDSLVNPSNSEILRKDVNQNVYAFSRRDTFLSKYTGTGSFQWQLNFSNKLGIQNVVCAPDLSTYLIGTFEDTLVIGSASLVSRGVEDIFLMHLDANGSLLWLNGIGSRGEETAGDICLNGPDLLITGSASDTVDFSGQTVPKNSRRDLFVAKYFNTGVYDTAMFAIEDTTSFYYQTYRSEGVEVEVDNNGDILLIGGVDGSMRIGSDTISYYVNSDLGQFIMKLDQNFNRLWLNIITPNRASELRVNSLNEIFYSSNFSSLGGGFSLVRKLTALGINAGIYSLPVFNWGSYSAFNSLDIDSCDNVYFAGWRYRKFPGQPWVFSYHVGQLSSMMTLNWIMQDSAYTYWAASSIVALSPNNCYVSGGFRDTLVLADTLIGNVPYSGGNWGYFHAKLQTTVGPPINQTPYNNLVLCAGATTTLNASSTGFISWYPTPQSQLAVGNGSSFVTPLLSAGTYTWYAGARSCTFTTSRLAVTVTVNPLPLITVNSGTLCNSSVFTIQPQGALSYSFSGITSTVSPNISSAYTVTGTDANGCINSAICQVSVLPLPQLQLNTTMNFMCAGETVTLNCSGAQSYSWHTGAVSNSIQVSPSANTNYSVTATGSNGCLSSACITQFVSECTGLGATAEKENSTIYPNPAEDKIRIPQGDYNNAVIYDVSGKQVLETKLVSSAEMIMVDKLPAGMYHLQLHETNGAVKRWKFVKR